MCALPSPQTIILAVSFMIMESTKYVALRLIGTVINVTERERERDGKPCISFLLLTILFNTIHMEITVNI